METMLLFIDFCLKHLESLQSLLNQGLWTISDCNLTITPNFCSDYSPIEFEFCFVSGQILV